MEQHFLTLAEIAPGLCRTKKTLENLVFNGQIRLGQHRLQTIKIGATRVVPRVSYEQLIRDLLREAGVAPEAAAGLVSLPAEPNSKEVTPPLPRRQPGRPRLAKKKGGAV